MRIASPSTLLRYLASHQMAWLTILLLMAGLILRLFLPRLHWLTDGPLFLFVCCLGLSLRYHWQYFLARSLMLLFHFCLFITAAALLLSPHFRASGYFELAEGQTLTNRFIMYEQGHFAKIAPDNWRLRQQNIHAEYKHADIGKTIHSQLMDDRNANAIDIGFMQAAHIDGYRIEPTGNMGYAAVLSHIDKHGKQTRGVVNFPGYPTQKIQSNPFRAPTGKWININLEMEHWPYQENHAWQLDIPASASIRLKTEQTRFTLKSGESQQLPSGKLKLESIRRWLGYKISHDPLAPWIFISSLLACISLSLYWLQMYKPVIRVWNRCFSRPH